MTIRERLAGLLRMSQGGEDEEGEEDEGDPAPQAAGHRAGLWGSTGGPFLGGFNHFTSVKKNRAICQL